LGEGYNEIGRHNREEKRKTAVWEQSTAIVEGIDTRVVENGTWQEGTGAE
jgi:hypothetical protein